MNRPSRSKSLNQISKDLPIQKEKKFRI